LQPGRHPEIIEKQKKVSATFAGSVLLMTNDEQEQKARMTNFSTIRVSSACGEESRRSADTTF
jgi:hypothetical protein